VAVWHGVCSLCGKEAAEGLLQCTRTPLLSAAAALRAMDLAMERHFTTYYRVLNRAIWSACQGSRILLGLLLTLLVPQARRSSAGRMIRSNAVVVGTLRPRAASAMRCVRPRST
jgi:hypothetical protein